MLHHLCLLNTVRNASRFFSALIVAMLAGSALAADGDGSIGIKGELKQWHKVTLDLAGPESSEEATPNPFTDYRMSVSFRHTGTGLTYVVPGYFAADGDAAETSAAGGTVWRAHLSPDYPGEWTYQVSFRAGEGVAIDQDPRAGQSVAPYDGKSGAFTVVKTDKTGHDFRGKGRLVYDGTRYLKFAGTGEIFLKCGPDAPENLLSYQDFDGTFHNDGHKDNLVKTWEAHLRDWKPGDPSWQGGKGKALIGAINYIHNEGLNSFSFLTNNIIGDDRNVFPYTTYDERFRMDCSKLDQWEIVFEHGTKLGMFLHFKTLEVENQMLHDNGETGPERKLYYRELIARYGHHLALNWNLCEENGSWGKHKGQDTRQRQAMAQYVHDIDPYKHHLVIHNGNPFTDLLGDKSALTGVSVQTSQKDFKHVHGSLIRWIDASKKAGKQWAVSIDEPGDAQLSLIPDKDDTDGVNHDNARMNALYGAFFAGGWGIEWYFGYKMDHSDLTCQDWRSRDSMWKQCKIALDFFADNNFPLGRMNHMDHLVEKRDKAIADYVFAAPGELYLVYLKTGPNTLDLSDDNAAYTGRWFNPRAGDYAEGPKIQGGKKVKLVPPSEKDWILILNRG